MTPADIIGPYLLIASLAWVLAGCSETEYTDAESLTIACVWPLALVVYVVVGAMQLYRRVTEDTP